MKTIDIKEWDNDYKYEMDDLGVTYSTQVSLFKVWSPTADEIYLLIYESGTGGDIYRQVAMTKQDKGIWQAEITENLDGYYYTYNVQRENEWYEVVDPYARATGVNGKRGMIVDLATTNPEGWEKHSKPSLKDPTDAIIYELHIRDLSIDPKGNIERKGKYLGLTEVGTKTKEGEKTGLDHIKELGVTHIQLMPCYDYLTVDEENPETGYNWGYDPQNYNVPEGSYATNPYNGKVRIKEFKTAIQALHENNIGVIMDVVYNHTAKWKLSKWNILAPNYYYRLTPDGAFSDGAACGNEIASEHFMVRKMIIDSVCYWAKEYQIDGFRFDLMGVLDIETMQLIRKELEAINPSIILYGEGWAGGPCALPEEKRALKKYASSFEGIGVFNDDLRDGVKGDVFKSEKKGFINGGTETEESVKLGIVGAVHHEGIDYSKVNYSDEAYASTPSQCINYVSAHDNLTLWDKIEATCKKESLTEKIKMHKLGNAIVLTSQGVPFLHAGVEFARTKGGNDNSYNASDEVNKLDWQRKVQFKEVFTYYQGLIAMRKAHPAFRMKTQEEINKRLQFLKMPKPRMIGYTIKSEAGEDDWEEIAVLFNGNKEHYKINNLKGNWAVVVDAKQAGTEVIREVEGSDLVIQGRSALVLVKRS